MRRDRRILFLAVSAALLASVAGLDTPPLLAQTPPAAPSDRLVPTVTCASKPGGRQHCPANTAKGVALVRSSGDSPCLLGKTWGYDDDGIWVSDGCTGEFVVGEGLSAAAEKAAEGKAPPKPKSPSYVPNIGFLLTEGDMGQIYMRLYTYFRYLNQTGLDSTYTDSFGTVKTVQQRQDLQLNKFFLPFYGWFMDPRFKYFLYIWSSNPAQGDPAQVVGAGNLQFAFNRFVTAGFGVAALPCVRSTEGQFPYWLGIDDRMTADEFFRGSYTTGFWVKGELATRVKYMWMLGNNLSQLGVSASQLDNGINTSSWMVSWMPTTGEFGLYNGFGDYDHHEKLATRLGAHYTRSRENRQSQPGTDSIENSQIRLTDGNVIFTPDLFGPGIQVNDVSYEMASADFGFKYKGFSVEGEYYWRWLDDFAGPGVETIDSIADTGYQLQTSAMLVPQALQIYLSGSEIRGDHGDGSELRAGLNWYPFKKRGIRANLEYLHLDDCPVGYTAVPYPVGGNGDIYHVNLEMNF